MRTYRKIIILALIGVNLSLLGGLIHTNLTPVQAQPFRMTDYVVVTGHVGTFWEALFIIDLATSKMAAWKWDRGRKRLEAFGGVNLPRDFKIRSKKR